MSLKIHPLFEKVMQCTEFATSPSERLAFVEWRSAGKPVVEEERKPCPGCLHEDHNDRDQCGLVCKSPTTGTDRLCVCRGVQDLEYQGVPWKLYPFSTADEAKKLLAAKDARIAELEAKLHSIEFPTERKLIEWMKDEMTKEDGVITRFRNETRNAALEEAAKDIECSRVSFVPLNDPQQRDTEVLPTRAEIAARIRALKKP